MINDKSLLEEDGSTLVMAAGICLAGQDEYEVDWTACPAKMNKYGRIETGRDGLHSYENWSQGRLPIRIPAETDSGPEILAEYEGTISSLENPEERLPFTVQFIRTELNDYYQVRCTELARSFWGPVLVKDPENPKTSGSEWLFAQSDIYSYAVQEVDGTWTGRWYSHMAAGFRRRCRTGYGCIGTTRKHMLYLKIQWPNGQIGKAPVSGERKGGSACALPPLFFRTSRFIPPERPRRFSGPGRRPRPAAGGRFRRRRDAPPGGSLPRGRLCRYRGYCRRIPPCRN